MDKEGDMIEEHLDYEYQNGEIDGELADLEKQIVILEMEKVSTLNKKLQDKLESSIALLRLHVQNYQRIVIFNRRRARQRLRRRQCTLRNFFQQSLMEMQIRFVEMLPLVLEPRILIDANISSSQCEAKSSPHSNFAKDSINEEKDPVEGTISFYNDIVLKFTNEQWLDTFHMSRDVFDLICTRLKASLDINMDVENWIAMCLYMFASGSKFCSVAMLFNVEKKFVQQSIFKFSECLLNEFSGKISMPNRKRQLEAISNGFYEASNMMPCVGGVLSLFKVSNVCDCGSYNNCGSASIKAQVCIDNNLLFRKVETTSHKPTMFIRSPNEISVYSKKLTADCEVSYFIVAPDNYPLCNWLMSKYENPAEPWEYNFNKSCGSLNTFRELSLKRLVGRWHILDSTDCILPESKSFIVKACCILHNILEENKEEFSLEWCKNFNPSKYECRLTTSIRQYFTDSRKAMDKRNVIAKLMYSTNK